MAEGYPSTPERRKSSLANDLGGVGQTAMMPREYQRNPQARARRLGSNAQNVPVRVVRSSVAPTSESSSAMRLMGKKAAAR
jgi:hypothetical protein